MAEWFYVNAGERVGPLDETELRERISGGSLDESSLVWKSDFDTWKAIRDVPDLAPFIVQTEVCAVSGERKPVDTLLRYGDQWVSAEHKDTFAQQLAESPEVRPQASVPQSHGYFYRDPRALATTTKWLFIGGTAAEIAMAGLSFLGSSPNEEANTADIFIGLVAIVYLLLFLAGIVVYCMWKVRVSKNAYALGGQGMAISPGWSVGFYFIPILMLWKPYQAMTEIYSATFHETAKPALPATIGWWWALFLISGFIGNLSFRLSLKPDLYEASLFVDLFSAAVVAIPLLLCTVKLISSITAKQVSRAG